MVKQLPDHPMALLHKSRGVAAEQKGWSSSSFCDTAHLFLLLFTGFVLPISLLYSQFKKTCQEYNLTPTYKLLPMHYYISYMAELAATSACYLYGHIICSLIYDIYGRARNNANTDFFVRSISFRSDIVNPFVLTSLTLYLPSPSTAATSVTSQIWTPKSKIRAPPSTGQPSTDIFN